MSEQRRFFTYIAKALIFAGTLFMLYIVLSSRSTDFELDKEEKAYLSTKDHLIVGYSERNPPFSYRGIQNREAGTDIEAVQAIGRLLGIYVQFTPLSTTRYDEYLRSGSVDILLPTPGRMRIPDSDTTVSLFDIPLSVFVDRAKTNLTAVQDLRGKLIGTVRGDETQVYIRDWSGITSVGMEDYPSLVNSILDKKIEAIAGKHQVILFYLQQTRRQEDLRALPEIYVLTESLYVRNDRSQLKAILDKAINHLHNTGALEEIEKRAIGMSFSRRITSVQKYFFFAVALLFLTILGILAPWGMLSKPATAELIIRPPSTLVKHSAGAPLTRMNVRELLEAVSRNLRLSCVSFESSAGEVITIPEGWKSETEDIYAIMQSVKPSSTLDPLSESPGWYGAELPRDGRIVIRERSVKPSKDSLAQAYIYSALAEITAVAVEQSAMQRTLNDILNTALDQSGEMFFVLTEKFLIEEAYGSIMPMRAEKHIGMDFLKLLSRDSLGKLQDKLDFAVTSKSYDAGGTLHMDIGGLIIPCSYRIQMKILSRGERLLLEVRDERSADRLSELAAEAYRVESSATQAASYISAFERMFLTIQGYVNLASGYTEREELQPHLTKIRDFAVRGSALSEILIAIARGKRQPHKVIELGSFVDDYVRPLAESFTTHNFEFVSPNRNYYVDGDSQLLMTGIHALLANAVEASAADSKITCTLKGEVVADTHRVFTGSIKPGLHAVVAISDSGTGIQAGDMQRLFKPFFTTKEPPHKGLGLPTVFNAARSVGGEVDIESEVGKGTVVKLYIPTREKAAEQEFNIQGNGERVLIICSNQDFLDVLVSLFNRYSYKPSGVTSRENALRLLHLDMFDAVLLNSDGGRAEVMVFVEEIRRKRPTVPVVVVLPPGETSSMSRLLRFELSKIIVRSADIKQIVRSVRELFSRRLGS